jgi:hypothetical protein
VGFTKLIFIPSSGQQLVLSSNNGMGFTMNVISATSSYTAAYLDFTTMAGNQPITWVYGGLLNGVPTWYQMYF